MAGALRKTMLFLGLAEDRGESEEYQEYEDYEYEEQEIPVVEEPRARVTPIRANQTAGELRRINTVHPKSYNDARVIGEAFRVGTPVIINLTELEDTEAKRVIDFAAGLVFGLHGSLERVTTKVFLLSPAHIEVAGATSEAAPQRSSGFYNQN